MPTSASLWCLWKLRNDMHFQNTRWRSMEVLLLKIAGTLQNWIILCPANLKDSLSSLVEELRKNASRPQRITGWSEVCLWRPYPSGSFLTTAGIRSTCQRSWKNSVKANYWWPVQMKLDLPIQGQRTWRNFCGCFLLVAGAEDRVLSVLLSCLFFYRLELLLLLQFVRLQAACWLPWWALELVL